MIDKIEKFVSKLQAFYHLNIDTIIRSLKRKTIEETFEYLKLNLENLPNSDTKEELLNELNEINKEYYKEKEVNHKV